MSTRILFLCPHGAGKSLLAATYLEAAAGDLGVDVEIDVAGPEPDEVNMPNVVAQLDQEGFPISWHPRLVTEADVAAADMVISIGCEAGTVPSGSEAGPVPVEWDVPLLSQDFDGSVSAIREHSVALAAELAARR